MDDLSTIRSAALGAVAEAADLAALDAARVAALGKKGSVTGLMKTLGGLAPDERKEFGARVNTLKAEIEAALEARKSALGASALAVRLASEKVDVSLPVRPDIRSGGYARASFIDFGRAAPVLPETAIRYDANGASVIDDKELNRVAAQTLDEAMTAKLAGANMQSNGGAPGGGAQLRLRGISTINGQSTPLYVIDGVIISSVVPAVDQPLEAMAERYFGRQPMFINHATDLGIPVRYDNPREVGADRLVNAVAIDELLGGPAIVFSSRPKTTPPNPGSR